MDQRGGSSFAVATIDSRYAAMVSDSAADSLNSRPFSPGSYRGDIGRYRGEIGEKQARCRVSCRRFPPRPKVTRRIIYLPYLSPASQLYLPFISPRPKVTRRITASVSRRISA